MQPPAKPQLQEGFIAIGVALTSFGLQGEIKVEPLTNFPARFGTGESVWFGGQKRRIQRSRWQGRVAYVKLTGINSPEAVAELRGQYLQVPESERTSLPADEYYQSDILGLRVETTAGAELGSVVEFLPTGANDVLVVRGAGGEVLIPMIADVVQAVDLPGGRLVIEPIEGLLPEPTTRRDPDRTLPAARTGRSGRRRRRAARPADEPRTEA